MARKPMVTRTIQTTRATVLCLNIQEGTPFSTEVVLPRTYKDEKGLLKAAENVLNTDTVKAVHISGATVQETLYGMSEQDFIRLAKPMEGRGKFATDENGDTDPDDTATTDEGDNSTADEGNSDDEGQDNPNTNGENNNADSWGNP